MWGRLVFTDYATGCLRKIYLRSRGVRESIPQFHGKRGAQLESQFGTRLRAGGSPVVEAEAPISYPIDGHDGFVFSGRMDFRVRDGEFVKVFELKSTESKPKLRQIKSGTFTTENLAQLVAYMIAQGTDQGELRYAYMEPNLNGEYVIKYERGFDVKIDDFGRLIIDGKPHRFTIYDQLAHTHAAASCIENDTIYDRPANYAAPFGSPCARCPFKTTCDAWDSGMITASDDFVTDAKNTLDGLPPP